MITREYKCSKELDTEFKYECPGYEWKGHGIMINGDHCANCKYQYDVEEKRLYGFGLSRSGNLR